MIRKGKPDTSPNTTDWFVKYYCKKCGLNFLLNISEDILTLWD
jgi:hypothetical protein